MLRAWLASTLVLALLLATSRLAHATEPGTGFAVVAVDGATDVAWPLAQGVYKSALLRPSGIDDARARILAGEPTPPLAPPELTELAELRAGVKGDDAASREVLAALSQKLGVHAILVVFAKAQDQSASARVYDATTRAFDAARYSPDAAQDAAVVWTGTLQSLERPYRPQESLSVLGTVKVVVPPPKPKPSESKPFYESPWFWLAIGTAVLVGGGVLIATNLQTSDTIHLKVQLP
jgi:hypothetical protein